MDRILASKLLVYLAIGLAVLYVWKNFYWLSNASRVLVSDWWR
jgi:hypothetical protein